MSDKKDRKTSSDGTPSESTDDDFYDGIQIRSATDSTKVNEEVTRRMRQTRPVARRFAHTVKRDVANVSRVGIDQNLAYVGSSTGSNSTANATKMSDVSSRERVDTVQGYSMDVNFAGGQSADAVFPAPRFTTELPLWDFQTSLGPSEVAPDLSDRTDEVAVLHDLVKREIEHASGDLRECRKIDAAILSESLGDVEQTMVHVESLLAVQPAHIEAHRVARRVAHNLDSISTRLQIECSHVSSVEAKALATHLLYLWMATDEYERARTVVSGRMAADRCDVGTVCANLELAFACGRDHEMLYAAEALASTKIDAGLCASAHNIAGSLLATRAAADATTGERAVAHFEEVVADRSQSEIGAILAQFNVLAVSRPRSAISNALGIILALESGADGAMPRMSSELRSVLHWLYSEILLQSGAEQLACSALLDAIDAISTNKKLLLFLTQSLVRTHAIAGSHRAADWVAYSTAAHHPTWSNHGFCRASHLAMGSDSTDYLLRAVRSDPTDGFARNELRRRQVHQSQDDEFQRNDSGVVQRNFSSSMQVFRALENGLVVGKDKSSDDLLETYANRDDVGDERALRWLAVERVYASGNCERLARHRAQGAMQTKNRYEGVALRRSHARALTRLAVKRQESAALSEASLSWCALADDREASSTGSEIELLAVWLALMAGGFKRTVDRTTLSKTCANDPDLWAQLTLELRDSSDTSGSKKVLPIPASEWQSAKMGHFPTRITEHLWVRRLVDKDWSRAAEAQEWLAGGRVHRETRSRALFRAALVREKYNSNIGVANDNLAVVRQLHPELFVPARSQASANLIGGMTEGMNSIEHDDIRTEIRRAESLERNGKKIDAMRVLRVILEKYPGDRLIRYQCERICVELDAYTELSAILLTQLERAEKAQDGIAKGSICEKIAMLESAFGRDSEGRALQYWRSASEANPQNTGWLRVLEREYSRRYAKKNTGTRMLEMLRRTAACLDPGVERSCYYLRSALVGRLSGAEHTEILGDYRLALEDDCLNREALFYLEWQLSRYGASSELATIERHIAEYFRVDDRANAAFLVRSGETWQSLGQCSKALACFQAATARVPGFAPALFGWREMALDYKMWAELVDVLFLEADFVNDVHQRIASLYLAGTVLMDKGKDTRGAIVAFRNVLAIDPKHRDSLYRLKKLLALPLTQ